jgi:hypothetical protein
MLDARVIIDTEAKSYSKRDPAKVLESQEKEKQRKCLETCLERRRHFTPFVCSVDGLLGREAKTFAKHLTPKLASRQQMGKVLFTCVNAQLSICFVRATHLCTIRGSRVPVHKISTHPISRMRRRRSYHSSSRLGC